METRKNVPTVRKDVVEELTGVVSEATYNIQRDNFSLNISDNCCVDSFRVYDGTSIADTAVGYQQFQ